MTIKIYELRISLASSRFYADPTHAAKAKKRALKAGFVLAHTIEHKLIGAHDDWCFIEEKEHRKLVKIKNKYTRLLVLLKSKMYI